MNENLIILKLWNAKSVSDSNAKNNSAIIFRSGNKHVLYNRSFKACTWTLNLPLEGLYFMRPKKIFTTSVSSFWLKQGARLVFVSCKGYIIITKQCSRLVCKSVMISIGIFEINEIRSNFNNLLYNYQSSIMRSKSLG